MSKVIVGFDASEQSDDALVLGQILAQVYAAELHVAVVLPRTRIPFEEAIAGDKSPPSWRSASTSRPSAGWREGGSRGRASMVRSAVARRPAPSTSTRRTRTPI